MYFRAYPDQDIAIYLSILAQKELIEKQQERERKKLQDFRGKVITILNLLASLSVCSYLLISKCLRYMEKILKK